jgi:hypothetical protein
VHLKTWENAELTELAGNYCLLTEKNRPQDELEEFRRRREPILAECERRGLQEAANNCRPSIGSIAEKEES